jgi:hypothetical protein
MKKLFLLLTIRLFIRNTDEALKIYNTLFSKPTNEPKKSSESIIGTTKKRIVEIKPPSTKKDELIKYYEDELNKIKEEGFSKISEMTQSQINVEIKKYKDLVEKKRKEVESDKKKIEDIKCKAEEKLKSLYSFNENDWKKITSDEVKYFKNVKKSLVRKNDKGEWFVNKSGYDFSENPTTKRNELMESLKYLKEKQSKTKQDKDSIGVLEAVLKNMS